MRRPTFFIGIGLASIAASFARTPFAIGLGLFVIGVFAAIYHPVGLAIVVEKWKNTGMRIAVNGVWGNLGVASAALITGYFIDHGGWRIAFLVPGAASIVVGVLYTAWTWREIITPRAKTTVSAIPRAPPMEMRALLMRVSAIVFLTTALSSIVLSTTFALPKVFDERLSGISVSPAALGGLAFLVFALGSMGQHRRPLPRPVGTTHRLHRCGRGASGILRHGWSQTFLRYAAASNPGRMLDRPFCKVGDRVGGVREVGFAREARAAARCEVMVAVACPMHLDRRR